MFDVLADVPESVCVILNLSSMAGRELVFVNPWSEGLEGGAGLFSTPGQWRQQFLTLGLGAWFS